VTKVHLEPIREQVSMSQRPFRFLYKNLLSIICIFGCGLGYERPALAQAVFNSGDNNANALPTETQGAPPFSTSLSLGDVPDAVAQSLPVLQAQLQKGLIITPSIGIQEDLTNSNFTSSSKNSLDLITTIRPGLFLEDNVTPSDNIILNYQPRISLYAEQSGQNQIAQSLNAAGDLALVPNSLTVSTRGYATEQPTIGGVNSGGTNLLSPNDTTTTQSYSVSPTYLHSFDGIGTLDINYLLSYTRETGNAAHLSTSSEPFFNSGNVTAQTETASFHTAPIYERFDDIISSSTTEDIGTGVLNNAHQYFFDDTIRYALFQHFILSGTGGYEDLSYAGLPPITVRDAIWNVEVNVQPSSATNIDLKYQHMYGFNAPFLLASYALTARTTLTANYSESLGSQQQSISSGVSGSSVNTIGQSVSSTSGTPVQLSNQLLSQQSNLQRLTIFAISSTTTWSRDTLSISFLHQDEKLVAVAPGFVGFSQNSSSGNITYTHALTQRLLFLTYFEYGSVYSAAVAQKTTDRYSALLDVNYSLSPSLITDAQLIVANQNTDNIGSTQVQYSLIFGLTKSF
jgi:uncharacterized protein (PEP-CTERM system associated)